ncbi:protein capI [Legionella busanensis]|uniref:Protein capI n=1 Tax=Legionella busanensis TaxID=190655 RepID=A0A378KHV0_9GAMM|nr:NAD-dependent epimerase [Legionella busanensis]STX81354.1 protein capI [Legionella busanensis]
MKILLTGCAGFIGMHTALRFLLDGNQIIGVDNLNNYYDVNLKKARLNQLSSSPDFKFYELDISDKQALKQLFATEKPQKVVHLAAQAGVRYSLINPHAYIDANIQGFMNILEGCRYNDVQHLVYASSSSVYGSNTSLPFDESQNIDHPISLYAATKKANELMAHTYSHLYNLPTTGLRFFTVYGPWGRPDMALFKFTQAILANKPIDIYNHGKMIRDFTYIDDIVEGIIRVTHKVATADSNFDAATPNPAISNAPYRVFNIGNNNPVPLISYISALEDALGIEAQKNYLPMQPGDVPATASNTEALNKWVDFKPNTPIAKGIKNFVDWYRYYYKVDNPVI